MGFYLTEPMTGSPAEGASARPSAWRKKKGLGAPFLQAILSTKYCDSELGLYYYGHRFYSPGLGRWLSRDPIEEAGGDHLFGFVGNDPVLYIDPMGLWEKDVHEDLTFQLAQKAGIACPGEIAAFAQEPDTDKRGAKRSAAKAASLYALAETLIRNGRLIEANMAIKKAEFILKRAAEWHFPVSEDGIVHPGSGAAANKVNLGIKSCNLELFSEGLHVLQDSWAHQGKPVWKGLGHSRGVWGREEGYWSTMPVGFSIPNGFGSYYVHIGSIPVRKNRTVWMSLPPHIAALSDSADNVEHWPEDARATGMRTYEELLKFKELCPCACPGPNGSRVATSSGAAMDIDGVLRFLDQQYPGLNKDKWIKR